MSAFTESSVMTKTLRILLVEDHLDTQRLMSRVLQSFKHEVRAADSVQTALALASVHSFDLVISDLGLPDGTGMDFIEKVRKTRKIPAIALTGFGMQQDVERAQQAGFDAHLTKPVNLQKLEAAIWKLLQDRQ